MNNLANSERLKFHSLRYILPGCWRVLEIRNWKDNFHACALLLFIENNIIDFLIKVVYNEMTYRYMFLWKILKLATIIWTLIKRLKFLGVKIVLFLRFKYTATYSCVSKLLSGKEEVKLLTLIILPQTLAQAYQTLLYKEWLVWESICRDIMSLI